MMLAAEPEVAQVKRRKKKKEKKKARANHGYRIYNGLVNNEQPLESRYINLR